MKPLFVETYNLPDNFHSINRQKLVNELKKVEELEGFHPVIYIQGGKSETRYDTDHEPIFRQESYFHYLFGVKEPDFRAIIDVQSNKAYLLIPRLPEIYATFMGKIRSCSEFCQMYHVDGVYYEDELTSLLKLLKEKTSKDTKGPLKILLMNGVNTDSCNIYPAPITDIPKEFEPFIDVQLLFPVLAECRVTKSKEELNLMRHVASVSSNAHVEVMRSCKPKMAEFQLESIFQHYCYYNFGARNMAYTPICACGPNSAILHYGHAGAPNDHLVLGEERLCLMDMGCEYHCYASDITCTFPSTGKFSQNQKIIYEGVLNAQKKVIEMLRPGESWLECHKAAEICILQALIKLGVVVVDSDDNNNNNNNNNNNDDVKLLRSLVDDDLLRLGAIFMPHGLGHFIGIDTHDVGGYLPGHPRRSKASGLKCLRTSRVLKPNMVLTVEPGCYFIDHLLDEALVNERQAKYLVKERLNELRGMGGVRLEDVVVITKDGCENYTRCPRTVDEVESVMAGAKWPPEKDTCGELKRIYLI